MTVVQETHVMRPIVLVGGPLCGLDKIGVETVGDVWPLNVFIHGHPGMHYKRSQGFTKDKVRVYLWREVWRNLFCN